MMNSCDKTWKLSHGENLRSPGNLLESHSVIWWSPCIRLLNYWAWINTSFHSQMLILGSKRELTTIVPRMMKSYLYHSTPTRLVIIFIIELWPSDELCSVPSPIHGPPLYTALRRWIECTWFERIILLFPRIVSLTLHFSTFQGNRHSSYNVCRVEGKFHFFRFFLVKSIVTMLTVDATR